MKIFFVGDFKNNTGPSLANQAIRKGLAGNKEMVFSDGENRIYRVAELLIKTFLSDAVCFCSFSKLNMLGIRIAKLFNKQTFYLMHGYATYEKSVDGEAVSSKELIRTKKIEQFIFSQVNSIFCVSEAFRDYMRNAEPDFKDKFKYNYNGLDLDEIMGTTESYIGLKDQKQIVSLGGGWKQKNNLAICRAIDKLNKEKNLKLKYVVIGLPHTEKEKICAYDFVTYYDQLPHQRVLEIMGESNLYIQNSVFETFGLAAVEALLSKCSLLLSSTAGCIGIMRTIKDEDQIFDPGNIEEISDKIEKVLKSGNADRLYDGISFEEIKVENAAHSLVEKMRSEQGLR